MIILLIRGGIYPLVLSRFLPFCFLGHAIQVLRGKYDNSDDAGEISHFKALTTALSSTIGMGNIAGVVGMSTKFFTCSLAIMCRGKDSNGELQGGPMYFIVQGLGKSWKPLASMFSLFGILGALLVINVNQLTQAINDIVLIPNG